MGMDISVLGVDLGKNVCSVVGLDASGAVVLRRRAKRENADRIGCENFRLAWSRWKRAAAPIILAASSPVMGTTCG